MTLEQRKKLSEAHKGKKPSKETLLKMAETSKRMWQNPEHKAKLKKTIQEKHLWFKGKKQIYICNKCNKKFLAYPLHRRAKLKFCSVSCKAKYLRGGQFQKGDKHPLWRGGLSNKQGYLWNWKYIKPKVLKRDNYTCKLCGSKIKLEVHHIDSNKHNSNPYNLITLCKKCHTKITFKFIENEFAFWEIEVPILEGKIEESIARLEELNKEEKKKFEQSVS